LKIWISTTQKSKKFDLLKLKKRFQGY
jgi:hypothetical protein